MIGDRRERVRESTRGFELIKVQYIHSWGTMAHTYNPSYSGGKDQEDCSLKPAQANGSRNSILRNTPPNKGWHSGSSGRAPA
jgi:hypothetical protein